MPYRLALGGYRFARDVYRYFSFGFSRFRGVYGTLEEAEAAAPGRTIGYNHRDLALSYLAELDVVPDVSDYPVLYHLKRIAAPAPAVFDFGGNIGAHYLRFRRHFQPGGVRWVVCDFPEMTRVGSQACAGHADVRFVNSVEELGGAATDLLLAVGSIQYVESPGALLRRMIEGGSRPAHVLFDQVPLYDGERFTTLQNGGGVYYAQYVFNRADFIADVEALGYRLQDSWKNPNQSCAIPFHRARSVPAYSGLYFSSYDNASETARETYSTCSAVRPGPEGR